MSTKYDPYKVMSNDRLKTQIIKLKEERKQLLMNIHSPHLNYQDFQIKLKAIGFKTQLINDMKNELQLRGDLSQL